MIFECENCGVVKSVLIDGYGFGDRLLEGVMFRVTRSKGGKWSVTVEPEWEDYMSKNLNTKIWLDKCLEYIEDPDVGGSIGECPKCGDNVFLREE